MGDTSYDIVADTTAGRVGGVNSAGVHVFRGVPYGAPTGGERRFKAPTPPDAWDGVRDATNYGPTAPQIGHAEMGGSTPTDPAAIERMKAFGDFLHGLSGDEPEQSEDCLVLNVWTPSLVPDTSRAVLVWIHGGGFETGSGSWTMYEGTPLAQRGDAVVVTINHRLGVLGFMHLDDIAGPDYAGSGNAGMLDIVLALHWVRDNIANFGGDPSKVLVFGGSGGASKTSTLLAMPSAKGLFQRGALLSGPYVKARSAATATAITEQFLNIAGVGKNEIGRLHDMPVAALLAAAKELAMPIDAGLASSASPEAFMPLQPVLDGTVITHHPLDPMCAPHGTGVAMMVGSTKDDMKMMMLGMPWFGVLDDAGLQQMVQGMFGDLTEEALAAYRQSYPDFTPTQIAAQLVTDRVMWHGSIDWCERKGAAGGAPTYAYRFDYETTALGGILGATHGGDIPFALANWMLHPMAGDRPENAAVSKTVSEAFVRFAHTGNPNHPGLPEWRPYTTDDRCTMVLNVESATVSDPMARLRALWSARSV